jgi:hypothetical protein
LIRFPPPVQIAISSGPAGATALFQELNGWAWEAASFGLSRSDDLDAFDEIQGEGRAIALHRH